MVCIYCEKDTSVINSRPQKRTNSVWRRRCCEACDAVFTTTEQVGYEQSLSVEQPESHIVPFARDQLFLSIYEACRHRPTAISDATALTATVITRLLSNHTNGTIPRSAIVAAAVETLTNFDHAAATAYQAFHSK